MHILIINFNLHELPRADYEAVCDEVSEAFASIPGLVSKKWLANEETNTYGGVYLFEHRQAMLDARSGIIANVGMQVTLHPRPLPPSPLPGGPTPAQTAKASTYGAAAATGRSAPRTPPTCGGGRCALSNELQQSTAGVLPPSREPGGRL